MNERSDPTVNLWYRQERPDGIFQVVAVDREDETIEVQHADGRIQLIGMTAWRDLNVREAEPPAAGDDGGPELPFRPVLEQYEKAAERLAVRIGRAAAEDRERKNDGVCRNCEGRIEANRLAAKPDALRCIECQRAVEAGELTALA